MSTYDESPQTNVRGDGCFCRVWRGGALRKVDALKAGRGTGSSKVSIANDPRGGGGASGETTSAYPFPDPVRSERRTGFHVFFPSFIRKRFFDKCSDDVDGRVARPAGKSYYQSRGVHCFSILAPAVSSRVIRNKRETTATGRAVVTLTTLVASINHEKTAVNTTIAFE